jgi:hypothetical protein
VKVAPTSDRPDTGTPISFKPISLVYQSLPTKVTHRGNYRAATTIEGEAATIGPAS